MGSIKWQDLVRPHADNVRPPRHRGKFIGYGPDELHLRENVVNESSPDAFIEANGGLFKTGTTSRDEGYFYWALLHIIGPEVLLGNYGMRWFYQSKVQGGSNRVGGAVIDFLVELSGPGKDLGIRIVTPYRHTQAGPFRAAVDFEQAFSLIDNNIQVVDVFSQNYINDKDGTAVIMAARRALEAQPDYSPIYHRFMGVS